MNQNCAQCQAANPTGARFCQQCGNTLGATQVQGRTVLAAPLPPAPAVPPVPLPPPPRDAIRAPAPAFDVKTIVERVQKVHGATALASRPPTTASPEQRELTVFVQDVSGSMGFDYDGVMNKLEASKRAAINMTLNKGKIDPYDEVAVVTFNEQASTLLPMSQIALYKQRIIEVLQSLLDGDGTDINEGLKAADKTLEWHRPGVVRRIVLLTDGQGGRPLRTAEKLKARGVVIDVIGVGNDPSGVNEKLLKKVASVVQGELCYQFIKNHRTLVAHYTQLANKTATG